MTRRKKRGNETKKQRALELYAKWKHKDRQFIVIKFFDVLDMSEAGANTYYYNIVSGKWK